MLLGGLELLLLKGLFVGAVAAGAVLAVITIDAIFEALRDRGWFGDQVYVVKPEVLYDNLSNSQENGLREALRQVKGNHKRLAINETTGDATIIAGNNIASELRNADILEVTW